MKIPAPFLSREIGAGDLVKKLASAVGIEQKPGCGCAKRQAAMNRALSFGPKEPQIVTPQAPAVIIPRAGASSLRPHRPSPWTVPPVPAPGWEVADQCATAMLFRRGGQKWIVWSIVGGRYSNAHAFGNEAGATGEFQRRCRP